MASTITADNGVSSGRAGINQAADSSGVLALQTTTAGGVATTALSISNTQVVTYTNQPVYSGGTANGVMYLNGSKVVTTGTALTFDGTRLAVGGSAQSIGNAEVVGNGVSSGLTIVSATSNGYNGRFYVDTTASTVNIWTGKLGAGNGYPIAFSIDGTEQMRLTSTGLGIGTSSPSYKLDVVKAVNGSNLINIDNQWGTSGANAGLQITTADVAGSSTSTFTLQKYKNGAVSIANNETNSAAYLGFVVGASERMRIDSSGNLGLGVTPSTWSQGKALEISGVGEALWGNGTGDIWMVNNCYYNSGWKFASGSGTAKATAYRQGAGVTAGTHTWSIAGSGTAGGAITFTDAMTLDASGNLGLGVVPTASTSSGILQNQGGILYAFSSSFQDLTQNAYYNSGYKYTTTAVATMYRQQAGAHVWFNAASGTAGNAITFNTAMQLDASGNLLVGGTFGAGFQVYFANTDGVNSRSGQAAGSSRSLYTGWYSATSTTQGTLSFNVTTNGNVTNTNNSYGAISDIKLKENIVDATPKLEKLCQVRVVNYNFKEGQTHKQIGVIAQELEQVFPGMVEESPDRDEEGNDLGTTTKQVKYSVFVPMLIKAIQEQQALIQTLTERITVLESK